MSGLVRIAVFDTGFFQCQNPNIFANRLIAFPRLNPPNNKFISAKLLLMPTFFGVITQL